jgi:hypothetical protein
MAALNTQGAHAPGPVTPEADPTKEDAPATDRGAEDEHRDCRQRGRVHQALRTALKRTIVMTALHLGIAWPVAAWLIQRGGLSDD